MNAFLRHANRTINLQRLTSQGVVTMTRHAVATPSSGSFSTAAVTASNDHGPPSVLESIVNLTFVDPSGARRQIPAYVGKTLYDTATIHGIDLGPASTGHPPETVRSTTWTEPLYGEGPTTGFDHVLLVGKGSDAVPPKTFAEERALDDYWDPEEIFPESRLATQITVKKEMDGMVVYVPDRLCDDIP